MKKNLVFVVCYNRIEKWNNRDNAIEFYAQGAEECDGSEAERYTNILAGLIDGKAVATDGMSISYGECKAKSLYRTTTAPDGSRDFGGKIWFPSRP